MGLENIGAGTQFQLTSKSPGVFFFAFQLLETCKLVSVLRGMETEADRVHAYVLYSIKEKILGFLKLRKHKLEGISPFYLENSLSLRFLFKKSVCFRNTLFFSLFSL